MPIEALIPILKNTILSRKRALSNCANANLKNKAANPSKPRIFLQLNQSRRGSERRGEKRKITFGATSWMAIALPQSSVFTMVVRMLFPGADKPLTPIPIQYTQHGIGERHSYIIAIPGAVDEKMIFFL